MNRNMDVDFGRLPAPKANRTRFKMQTVKRLQTMQHGRLTPFFVAPVYPGDTWQLDTNVFIRMDTSAKVPLDDIFIDIYYFFVPYRLLDEDFIKIFGDTGDPYDTNVYQAAKLTVDYSGIGTGDINAHALLDPLFYLNYGVAADPDTSALINSVDEISSYPLMAYWKIWNEHFRDENLQASIDIQQFKNGTYVIDNQMDDEQGTALAFVNRLSDYFSVGFTSPQKGAAQTIPLASVAPVITGADHGYKGTPLHWADAATGTLFQPSGVRNLVVATNANTADGPNASIDSASLGLVPDNLWTDLSSAAGTIDQLLLNAAIQDLYRTKLMYGTRFVEVLSGQWGLDVSEYLVGQSMYLGGKRGVLSNVPVLNTASDLADMKGNSATLYNDGGFFKSFVEWGVIIGLACTRVKHVYTQGLDHHLYRTFTELDFYNRAFSNIGLQGKPKDNLFNVGYRQSDTIPTFNYDQAWDELRNLPSRVAGGFSPLSGTQYSNLRSYWNYADYYAASPTFNGRWLKEDPSNVARTLTNQLLPDATDGSLGSDSQQFMCAFYTHPIATRELPANSVPAQLGRRY